MKLQARDTRDECKAMSCYGLSLLEKETMSTIQETAPGPKPTTDERIARVNPLRRLLVRPEMGAIAGSIAVWLFFAIVAGNRGFLTADGTSTYLITAADIGIMAIAVSLL